GGGLLGRRGTELLRRPRLLGSPRLLRDAPLGLLLRPALLLGPALWRDVRDGGRVRLLHAPLRNSLLGRLHALRRSVGLLPSVRLPVLLLPVLLLGAVGLLNGLALPREHERDQNAEARDPAEQEAVGRAAVIRGPQGAARLHPGDLDRPDDQNAAE